MFSFIDANEDKTVNAIIHKLAYIALSIITLQALFW